MTKRVAIYLRVSTDQQTTENQRLELERVALQRGWTVTAFYTDDGISGAKGRDKLYLHQQAIDTTTPSGRAMFQMCGVFAEFERSMIQERVKAGLARRKAKGLRIGRKPVSSNTEDRIRELRATGMGIIKIARQVGVGVSVVQRVVAVQ
jgi:DNA invertase Pin-like site-specific DNA recombinase